MIQEALTESSPLLVAIIGCGCSTATEAVASMPELQKIPLVGSVNVFAGTINKSVRELVISHILLPMRSVLFTNTKHLVLCWQTDLLCICITVSYQWWKFTTFSQNSSILCPSALGPRFIYQLL